VALPQRALALALTLTCLHGAASAAAWPPARLQDTGFEAAPRLEFAPRYPLWTDGAAKRRWVSLPRGAAIDARQADAWEFPRGTRLWKEFSFGGRKVETRYIERGRDGQWRFAAYVWNEAGTEAVLAPERGTDVALPHGSYRVPGRNDCIACHGSTEVPVLGLAAVQAQPSDLRALLARGWLRPAAAPAEIAAASELERAALGYLHGNCAHCHNTTANRVPLALTLRQRAADPAASRDEVLRSLLAAPSRYRAHDATAASPVIAPGEPDASVVVHRMTTRDPRVQMPPLGTSAVDTDGLALVRRWIATDLQPKEKP
jgi:hypothetical protein